jgi:hypothetical protein
MGTANEQQYSPITSSERSQLTYVTRVPISPKADRMTTHPNLPAFCWFGATCLAMIAFVLVFVGIEQGASVSWSAVEIWLVVLAAAALVLMVVLIAIAFAVETR